MKSTKAEARGTSGARTQEAGEYPVGGVVRAEAASANPLRTKAQATCAHTLMEAAMDRNNLKGAYQRVIGNQGAAGVDGIGIDAFKDHLKRHWPPIKAKLLAGTYIPSPVRRVDIPKPQGGVRTLGIPTLTDRWIQQALHQVLQPIFEADFSASSYGFRPCKNAHQAVKAAQGYIAEGRRVVVDMDLEQFFDRVNHDLLMSKLAAKIGDRRVLQLIRRYLQAGMMADGTVSPRTQGTPQGGPLSPLLSNVLLTDLDRERERRGHAFCRYADDCNIYVKSRAAGERVLASLTRFLTERLKLKVNQAKSAVDRPWRRPFLGYSTTVAQASATANPGGEPTTAQDPATGDPQGRTRSELVPNHTGTQSGAAGLGGVLQADSDPSGAESARWLAAAQTAVHLMAAVEAHLCPCTQPDEGGTDAGAGVALGHQRAWPVVEQRGQPHECGLPESLL